jgi:uncharacterized protein
MISTTQNPKLHSRHVTIFLFLTFLLTWGLDFILWRTVGLEGQSLTLLFLQLQMLIPGFVAILLMRFVFRDNSPYTTQYRSKPVIFLYFYLGMVLSFTVMAVWGIIDPQKSALIGALSGGVNLVVIIALVAIRLISDGQSFAEAGLAGGRIRDWFLWGSGFLAFYILTAFLNSVFNLGRTIDLGDLISQLQLPGEISPQLFFVLILIQTVAAGSLLSIIFGFGEEFGWRGFLQSELFKSGRLRGVLFLGLVWGAWHYPLVWMGYNYPGHPLLGMVLMTLYTLLLGVVLSHVVLKTGAIWLAAFLHTLNNQTVSFINSFIYQVSDPAYSFTYGIWGLLLALPVVLLLLRDPAWKKN